MCMPEKVFKIYERDGEKHLQLLVLLANNGCLYARILFWNESDEDEERYNK